MIAPGLVQTPMASRAAQDVIQQFIATKQPLDGGRIGKAADLDAAVSCCCPMPGRLSPGRCWRWTAGGA